MTDDVLPQKIIDFTLKMSQDAGETKRRAYSEAEKKRETGYGSRQLQKGTTYSKFEMLFSMVAVAMAGINAVNKKTEKLANNKDVSTVKQELTEKVNQTLTPLQEIIKQQKEREERGVDIYE